MFITSDKKDFYERLSSRFNCHFYCTIATNDLHQDLSCSVLRNSRKTQQCGKRHTEVLSHARENPPRDCSTVARIRKEYELSETTDLFIFGTACWATTREISNTNNVNNNWRFNLLNDIQEFKH